MSFLSGWAAFTFVSMKDLNEVRDWLEAAEQDYAAGVALYRLHGTSAVVAKVLEFGESAFTRAKLAKVLRELIEGDPARAPRPAAPPVAPPPAPSPAERGARPTRSAATGLPSATTCTRSWTCCRATRPAARPPSASWSWPA
ncbi:MAG TPA: hypothetical protein VF690_03615 [Hymenobacter sp.]|jgi:hypothetical protein